VGRLVDSVAQTLLGAVLVCGVLVAATRFVLPGLAPETSVAPPGQRAMWMWDKAAPAQAVDWARNNGVRSIFVYVDPARLDGAGLDRLRALRALCDDAGILLDALGGEPEWVLDHAKAVVWQYGVVGLGLFHGVHLDIEPYLLPDWNTRRDDVVRSFLDLLDQLTGTVPVELDVPFWYGTVVSGGANLADSVVARVDALTVMSYRDTATGENSMVDVSADLLKRAAHAAIPVRLGAETQETSDCGHCSFAGTTQHILRTRLSSVDAAAEKYSSFAGIAVHQYSSWASLPSG
jgi:hypothetical protein